MRGAYVWIWLSGKRPGSNMGALGVVLEASWALLGRSWRHLARSWGGLGGLLGALGRVSDALGALLEATWPVQEAKMPPEGSPRGSKIDSKRRLALKTGFLQKVLFFQRIFMIFEVSGRILGA